MAKVIVNRTTFNHEGEITDGDRKMRLLHKQNFRIFNDFEEKSVGVRIGAVYI